MKAPPARTGGNFAAASEAIAPARAAFEPVGVAFVEGIGFWSSRLPGWDAARAILRGEARPPDAAAPRPQPSVLAPTERRRAPDSVAVALEVASAACACAERPPESLASVFASTLGDTMLSDYLCGQLARAPLETSPTKFHNSVHNAAAGYWAIATGCPCPYTAMTAHHHTFGMGFVVACAHGLIDAAPVLYVAYDIEARGPIATVAPSRGVLGAALVLAPQRSPRAVARLAWRVSEGEAHATPARASNAALVEGNAMAGCLALFEALADGLRRQIALTLTRTLTLQIEIEPPD